jgi:uncharacterized protein
MTQRVIETLSESECFKLIRQQSVGRFIFQDADGPAAVPVNYGVAGEKIVFRVEQRSHLRDMLQGPVAFEVDHTEQETGAGWSVLIRGSGLEVDMESVPELLRLMRDALPHPWAEGIHNVWMSITARKVTGRRLTVPYLAAIF